MGSRSMTTPNDIPDEVVERVALALNLDLKDQWSGESIPDVPLSDPTDWAATGGTIDLSRMAAKAILAYRAAMRERGYVDCRIVKTADGRIEYKFDPPIELNADGGLFQPPPSTPSKPNGV